MSKNPTRLLDITRKLTGGIVRGRRSHIDRYAYRFKRQAQLADTAHHLIPPNELIAARLPAVCHQTTNKFLVYMNNLLAEIESTQVDVDITNSKLLPDNMEEKKSLSDSKCYSNPILHFQILIFILCRFSRFITLKGTTSIIMYTLV